MALDPVKNFVKVEVSQGYNDTATSIVLSTGEGAKLPAPATEGAFNLVWWNSTDYPDPADDPNKEIVRCTARTTDTLTVTRAQEETTATVKNLAGKTYKMVLAMTKKMKDDIGTAVDAKVTGPASATNEDIAVFDGTTGKIIKDGGKKTIDFVEGAGTRAVLKSYAFYVNPGATPNTNINIDGYAAALAYNIPTVTNATNLAKSGSSGSWSLSADGKTITLNLTEDVVGVLSYSVLTGRWNTAEAVPYYPFIEVSGGNILVKITKVGSGTSLDWTAVVDANDVIGLLITFVTSS